MPYLDPILLLKVVEMLGKAFVAVFPGKGSRNDKKAAKLVSESITELLSANPDILAVRIKLSNASVLASASTTELARAEEMLEKVTKYSKKKGSCPPAPKKAAKQTAKKKASSVSSLKSTKRAVTSVTEKSVGKKARIAGR